MRQALALLMGLALFLTCSGLKAQEAQGTSQKAAATQASVDQDIQLMRKDLQSDKKLIVAANMVLTDIEAQKFWPVYDQYAAELAKVNDAKVAIIKEYAANFENLSDAKAAALIERWSEADKAAVQLRMKYLSTFQQVIPGTKVARFFQVDRRIGLVVDLQLASEIPLVTQ